MLIAGLISGVIGVILAFKGYGVYALVTQHLLNNVIGTIVLWKISRWRPEFAFSWQKLKKLSSFSSYMVLSQIGNQLLIRLNVVVIAKLFSPATLGFYSIADSLNQLVITYTSGTIGKVFFPVLSQLQNDLIRFRKIFLKVIRFTSFLTFLLAGGMVLCSSAIILILFGEKWLPSVFIFQILMIKIANFPINSIIVGSFLAQGKAKENFWYGNIRKLFSLIPFGVAYFYGFDPFLYSLVIVSIVGTLFNNIISAYSNKISFVEQTITIYKFGLVFMVSMGIVWLLNIPNTHLVLSSTLNSLLFVGLYLSGSFFLDQEVYEEYKQVKTKGVSLVRAFFLRGTRL